MRSARTKPRPWCPARRGRGWLHLEPWRSDSRAVFNDPPAVLALAGDEPLALAFRLPRTHINEEVSFAPPGVRGAITLAVIASGGEYFGLCVFVHARPLYQTPIRHLRKSRRYQRLTKPRLKGNKSIDTFSRGLGLTEFRPLFFALWHGSY